MLCLEVQIVRNATIFRPDKKHLFHIYPRAAILLSIVTQCRWLSIRVTFKKQVTRSANSECEYYLKWKRCFTSTFSQKSTTIRIKPNPWHKIHKLFCLFKLVMAPFHCIRTWKNLNSRIFSAFLRIFSLFPEESRIKRQREKIRRLTIVWCKNTFKLNFELTLTAS